MKFTLNCIAYILIILTSKSLYNIIIQLFNINLLNTKNYIIIKLNNRVVCQLKSNYRNVIDS